jgi:glycosyltransferase involved in cell wall biosynthesis
VLFKAAIAGLPIVTTQVRAAAEYFTDGLNSLFCTTDPADIAAKIEQLISDTELRQSMNDANRMFADILTAEKVAAEYLEIYKEIV